MQSVIFIDHLKLNTLHVKEQQAIMMMTEVK